MGDIDHEHGKIRTLLNRLFMDVHEVFESPILFRVSKIALPLEAQPIRVDEWSIPQRSVTTQEYHMRCFGGFQIRLDDYANMKHVGKLLMPQRHRVDAGLSLFVDTRSFRDSDAMLRSASF